MSPRAHSSLVLYDRLLTQEGVGRDTFCPASCKQAAGQGDPYGNGQAKPLGQPRAGHTGTGAEAS